MINTTPIAQFMMIALHFMTCTALLCSILVWIERHENKKQRTNLAIVWFIIAAMMMVRVIFTYNGGGSEASYPVLPIGNLYGGFWTLLLLFFYPVEVVNPGWLKWRTVLLLFLPMIVVSIVLAVVPMEFRELNSWTDMLAHIKELNVWFRLLILFIFIVPYTIILLCVPYNWRKSSVGTKWIKIYVFGVQGIGVLYLFFMLTGSLLVSGVHLLYCTLFLIYVTYQELFLRLLPDIGEATKNELSTDTIVAENVTLVNETPLPGSLWEQLAYYMKNQKPWLSPNITIIDVAQAIGCSRPTLSATISANSTDSFHSLVARYRIEAFCEMAKKKEIDNINEALFAVGFRSRSTAYERFKEHMGVTPAEYVKTTNKR